MKLNIFRVHANEVAAMLSRFADVGLQEVSDQSDSRGWRRRLYYCTMPEGTSPEWLAPLLDELPDDLQTEATYLYAAIVMTQDDHHYVVSYGKAHFYVRPFADYDFGMELGKRIANPNETKHISARRGQGRRRKDIKSYLAGTRLDPEAGESVDFLELEIAEHDRVQFGRTGRFGTSAQLTVPKLKIGEVGHLFDQIEAALGRDELFKVPRATVITDEEEVRLCNERLVEELRRPVGETDTALQSESFDLWGVDFVFPSTYYEYELHGPGRVDQSFEILTLGQLKEYITAHSISDDGIFRIKVKFLTDEGPQYTRPLLEVLDFIADKGTMLHQGKWMKFNQDYIDALDSYIDEIEVESAEPEFLVVNGKEGDFNASEAVVDAGYTNTDKNFQLLRTRVPTPIEAHDLRKGSTVYAVKFGSGQKLGTACDQAIAVLEILRNEAATVELEKFDRFCLWFGYKGQKPLPSISQTGSIILKQKIDLWARRTREMGWTPVLKLSHHTGDYPDAAQDADGP